MTFPPSVWVTSGPGYTDVQGETGVTDDVICMDALELIIANGCHYELILDLCDALGIYFTWLTFSTNRFSWFQRNMLFFLFFFFCIYLDMGLIRLMSISLQNIAIQHLDQSLTCGNQTYSSKALNRSLGRWTVFFCYVCLYFLSNFGHFKISTH